MKNRKNIFLSISYFSLPRLLIHGSNVQYSHIHSLSLNTIRAFFVSHFSKNCEALTLVSVQLNLITL